MTSPARLLFVCVHNAGRSQMAAAFFNVMSHERCARARSAGTQPADHVWPEVVTAMHERDVDLDSARPQPLTPELVRDSTMIVTLGCGDVVDAQGVPTQDWPFDDPHDQSPGVVRKIRDAIEKRVWKLIVKQGWVRLQPRALPSVGAPAT
jgi:arsenate reductase